MVSWEFIFRRKVGYRMIAYITINDETNLGNRLQSYATFILLSKYDETYCLVRNYFCDGKKKRIPWSLFRAALKIKDKISNNLNKIIIEKSLYDEKRKSNFIDFSNLINNGEILSQNTDYTQLEKKYSCFVVGSDQIWNPGLFQDMYINMLGFVKTKKKISLSSSISKDELFPEEKYEFKRYLTSFYNLSCREEQGSQIIREIVHRECQTLIDPTLMLEKEEWVSVMKKPVFHNDGSPYILLYFLGGMTNKLEENIRLLGVNLKLRIIDLYDKNSIYYSCGPKEFIYLISNASLVLTDSFHGSIFSYIFEKPFRTFVREDINTMNSRLITLFNKLNLCEEIFACDTNKLNQINENDLKIMYDKTALKQEQKKVYDYLQISLNEFVE